MRADPESESESGLSDSSGVFETDMDDEIQCEPLLEALQGQAWKREGRKEG